MQDEKTSKKLTVLFCFFMYPVMLRCSVLVSYAIIYGLPLCSLLLHIRSFRMITKRQWMVLSLCAVMLPLCVAYPMLHETGDYSYIPTATFVFRKLLIYVFLACMLVKRYQERASAELFYYYFALATAIYVIGTLCLVFIPGLRGFWLSIFRETIERSGNLSESFGYTFRIGWQGFAGFRVTFRCTLSCLFALYLFYSDGSKIRLKRPVFLALYGLCLLGNMFYGRSGLAVTLAFSAAAAVIWNRRHVQNCLWFALWGMLFLGCVWALREVPVISDWYIWMSKPFINLFTTGHFDNVSLSALVDSTFMPDWETIFFGDGYYTFEGTYYMGTDSGVMRNVLFWGIAGALVSYGATFCAVWDVRRKSLLLFFLIIGSFAAFEYKGDMYYEYITLFLSVSFVETLGRWHKGNENPITGRREIWYGRSRQNKCADEYVYRTNRLCGKSAGIHSEADV